MSGIEDLNKIQMTPFMCWVLAFLFFLAAIVAYKVGTPDVALGCVGAAGGLVVYAQSLPA